jgi:hypothetical protein
MCRSSTDVPFQHAMGSVSVAAFCRRQYPFPVRRMNGFRQIAFREPSEPIAFRSKPYIHNVLFDIRLSREKSSGNACRPLFKEWHLYCYEKRGFAALLGSLHVLFDK